MGFNRHSCVVFKITRIIVCVFIDCCVQVACLHDLGSGGGSRLGVKNVARPSFRRNVRGIQKKNRS